MGEMLAECFKTMGVADNRKNHKQGVCPVCGSKRIAYGDLEYDIDEDGNDVEVCEGECSDCKAYFDTKFKVVFDKHFNIRTKEDRESNKYDDWY